MPIASNSKFREVVLRVNNASETFSLANLQLSGEIVLSASIAKIYWSGPLTIQRGANTHYTLVGNGNWDLDTTGTGTREDATGSIVVNATGGCAIVVIKKQVTNPNGV